MSPLREKENFGGGGGEDWNEGGGGGEGCSGTESRISCNLDMNCGDVIVE